MSENKAQTLTELYGLRAGLSAIAVESDNYKSVDAKTDEKIQKQKSRCQNMESDLQETHKKLREKKEKLANAQKVLSEPPPQEQHTKRAGGTVKCFFVILFAVAVAGGVIAACIAIISALFHTEGNIEGTEDVVVGVIISIVVCVIGLVLIGLVIWLAVRVSSNEANRRVNIRINNQAAKGKYNTAHDEAVRNVAELPVVIKNLYASIDRFPAEIEQAQADYKKAIAEREQILPLYIAKGSALHDVVTARYNNLLAESDWASLDYVIYLLETGRADTIKEALQQLDAERRKNEIVNSIGIAAEYVSGTIHRSIQTLQVNMEQCFRGMANMLQTAFQRQETLLKTVVKGISTVSFQMSNIQASVDFGNALLQKANETSEQIAGSVHYLCDMAESADIRRRSGG